LPPSKGSIKNALLWAVIAAGLTLTWQALTVQANYDGHWSGLFRTGRKTLVPPELESSTYRDSSPRGYDGQFYRFVAHDPRVRGSTRASLDAPVLRAGRILVPLLAWMAALGRPGWIDGSYICVVAGFIFGGVYWMARWMETQGRNAAWGLLFLIVPPTIVSIDRMTVDVALGALAAAFVYYLATERDRALWFTLAAACLVRETGLLLVAACVLPALVRRDLRKAAIWAAAALPALCWIGYLLWGEPVAVAGQAPFNAPWGVMMGFQVGVITRLLNPTEYGLAEPFELIARVLDSMALLAMIGAAVLAFARLLQKPRGPLAAALGLHAVFLSVSNKYFWVTPFGYSRPFAPLFVMLLMGPGVGYAVSLCVLVDLRLLTEIRSQVMGVLHWL
jgi:hypothetical protein